MTLPIISKTLISAPEAVPQLYQVLQSAPAPTTDFPNAVSEIFSVMTADELIALEAQSG